MSLTLEVQIESSSVGIPGKEDFQHWAASALEQDDSDVEIVIRVVDEEESRHFNHQYRGKDKATNVLSFPFESPPGMVSNHLGDLLVCAPVVEAEAAQQGKPLAHHWAHMIVHGVLHLRGFDHLDDVEAQHMEDLERCLLQSMDISDPYKEPHE